MDPGHLSILQTRALGRCDHKVPPAGRGWNSVEWGDQLEPLGESQVHPLVTNTEERGSRIQTRLCEGLARTQSLVTLIDQLSKGAMQRCSVNRASFPPVGSLRRTPTWPQGQHAEKHVKLRDSLFSRPRRAGQDHKEKHLQSGHRQEGGDLGEGALGLHRAGVQSSARRQGFSWVRLNVSELHGGV